MIKFKTIRPFIIEMLVFIFVLGVLTAVLLIEDYVEIKIKAHLFAIISFTVLIVSFLALFSRVVNLGVRALFDFIFQSSKHGNYEFIKELPYQASVFSEKFGSNHKQSYGMYYLIQCKKNGEVYTFISPAYLNLETGKEYTMTIASASHIVLECLD